MTANTILRKTGKIFLYLILGIIALIVIIFIWLNTNSGKTFVKNRVVSFLHSKLKTNISIGEIDYSLPKWVELKNVYIEDQKKDTLLFGEELSVDLEMLKLINGNTHIRKVYLKNILAKLYRQNNDSVFNYQFIIDAFTGNKKETTVKDTAALKLSLDNLILNQVKLNFNDQFGGTVFNAAIDTLNTELNRFQPDRLAFEIKDFFADGVKFNMEMFAGKPLLKTPDEIPDSILSPYNLFVTAGGLKLNNVTVSVDDKTSGMFYSNDVKNLTLEDALFDVAKTVGKAKLISLDSSEIIFNTPVTSDSTFDSTNIPSPSTWRFLVDKISLKNDNIIFNNNTVAPATEGVDLNHINATKLFADVSELTFSPDTISANIQQLAFNEKSGFVLDSTTAALFYSNKKLYAKDLVIKTPQSFISRNFEMSYDSIEGIKLNPAGTSVDVDLNNTRIAFNDIYLLVPAIKKSLDPSQFKNKYLSINTSLNGSLKKLFIPSLKIGGLDGSNINAKGVLYNLQDAERFAYDLTIFGSNFKKSDILKFVPADKMASFKDLPKNFAFSGRLIGNTKEVAANINLKSTGANFNGVVNVKNFSDPAKLKYGVIVNQGTFTRDFILSFIPPNSLPEGFSLPENISAKGSLAGNSNNLKADVRINTDYGDASVKGFINNFSDPKTARYDLDVSTYKFNVGKLIGNDSLGIVSVNVVAKGKGFDYKTMVSNINTDISELQFNGYNYTNAKIDAKFNNGEIISNGNINDPALKLNFDISGNVKSDYPIINGFVRIDTAQLKTLKLYPDSLNFSLTANVNAQSLKPHGLNAFAIIDSIMVDLKNKHYSFDSVELYAKTVEGIDSVYLKSEFANLTAAGDFDYTKISDAVINYINNYYPLAKVKPVTEPQQIEISGSIEPHPIFMDVVEGLKGFDRVTFDGQFNSSRGDSALNFQMKIPHLVYNTIDLKGGDFTVNSKNEKINYNLQLEELKAGNNQFYSSNISGAAANDSISTSVLTNDESGKKWFGLNATLASANDVYTVRLTDNMILNYETWNVNSDNYFQYSKNGILVNNFTLTSDTAKISVNSRENIPDSPIDVSVDNFNLKSLSSFVNKDTVFLAGILNADLVVSDFKKSLPAFQGEASITALEFKQNPIGNLNFTAAKQDENNISSELKLSGNNNDITAQLKYNLNTEGLDGDIDIASLNFKTLEGLSGGQLERSSGKLHGNVSISGKISDPRWNGSITFDTTSFALSQFGAPLKIDNQTIYLNYPNISFNNFKITDSLNHPLVIDGTIKSRSLSQYDLNLDVNATDFIIVNQPKAIDNQISGYAAINTEINIKGTSEAPVIEGSVSVNDESDISIILPERSFDKDQSKSIVRFVDLDTFDIAKAQSGFKREKDEAPTFVKSFNYNLNVSISKNAALTIVIDPVTGDELRVQGDAQLNAGVDPGGNIILSGTYILDKGSYVLNYQFLQRKFVLDKGSTITFAGEPMNARVDITAEYIASTSSKELLSNEVANADAVLANSFNQKIPYRVILKLSGVMSKPDIKFDIQLPDEESDSKINSNLRTTVENKLIQLRGDESAMNKQVFSLLLLNRFVGEQSSDFFSAGEGGGFDELARQSVSQFLSSALNQIADDIFKGVDVDLSLQSYTDYQGTGSVQKTDLNLSLSKSFLNDRLTVTVGKNFELEGQNASSKSTAYIPDITFGYKLSKDGKYMLKAYRKSQFEVVLDGYVTETGVGFLMTMDYDKFKELFQKRKNAKK